MKNSSVRLLLLSLLLWFATPRFLFAQNDLPDAHLTGTLLDSSGGGVGGVRVTAQAESAAHAHTWTATSNTDGAYALAFPAGRYRVQFLRSPFVPRDFVFDFSSGQQRKLDLNLDLNRLSESVVVTAQAELTQVQDTVAPVTIITRDEIDARQAVSLPDALLFVPGIAIGRTGAEGGTASIFLNGGNSNFTKVLVDGAPINPPGSAVDFSNITLDIIDKIEVVRGAESAIYGTDAVSGVIQIFTHRGTTRIPEVSVFGEGGNFSSARGGGQISGLLGAFDYSGAGSYLQTAGQGANNDFLNRTLSGNFGYAFSDSSRLRLSLRNNTSEAGIPGQTAFEPPSLYQRYALHVFESNARWDFVTGTHWHHQLGGGESYNRQHSFNPKQSFYATDPNAFCPQGNAQSIPTAEFCDFTGDSRYQYNRANLSAQTSYLLPNFGATAGYQYEVENASIPFLSASHVRRNNQGGFLDFHYQPHPRAVLNFGARAEANANFGTRVVPRAGAALVLRYGKGFWGETRYRVFYGQGIKEPRFDQIYSDKFGDIGNPSLKPEASRNWSTGIEQNLANDRVKITGEYFSNLFYNIISFGFQNGAGFFFNTDRARARGTNISVEIKPNRWFRVMGNYSYDDTLVLKSPNAFFVVDGPGNPLLRRPLHSGSLTLNAAFRRMSWTFSGYFSGKRADSDFQGAGLLIPNPGYARFDLTTRYDLFRGLSVYGRAANLFDKRYQDALGYPALGRDVRVGMNYRFGGRN
ncbi:MAG: TonB-dependent vitamin B12 receptor BtuB [Candidatus Acidiferrum sp.]